MYRQNRDNERKISDVSEEELYGGVGQECPTLCIVESEEKKEKDILLNIYIT